MKTLLIIATATLLLASCQRDYHTGYYMVKVDYEMSAPDSGINGLGDSCIFYSSDAQLKKINTPKN